MATNTYKSGLQRLNQRSLSSNQRAGIYASRCLYDPIIKSNNIFEENSDTVERKKIHCRIKKLVEDGKTKSEIVNCLISEFPESDLRRFFESYAQHHIDKQNKGKGRDDE